MAFAVPAPTFDGVKCVPVDDNPNAKPSDFATKFVVAFSEVPVISDAGGTAVIYKNGGLFKTFPVTKTSSSVAVVGKTLEITHGITSFTQGEVYSVAITDGAIVGLGVLAQGTYIFTVGDYVKPSLSTTAANFTPKLGAVSVNTAPVFSLAIPFSENVEVAANPGNKAVYIYKADGTVVDIVKVSSLAIPAGGVATVTVPVANTSIFSELTNYYVTIDAGAFVDASANKNAFDGLSNKATWTFTTRDNSAPVITADVSNVLVESAKLNVTLNEKGKYYYMVQLASAAAPADAAAVKAGGTAVTVDAANTVVSKTLSVAGSTEYKVYIVAENGEAVNPNLTSAIKTVTFKTVDNIAPTVLARGTLLDAAKKTNALFMVFNEQVQGGSGDLNVRLNSDESYVKTIAASAVTSRKITAAEVTANTFKTLAYTPTANDWVSVFDLGMTLPSKVDYYVTFPTTYLKDMSNNAFAGAGFIVPINKTDWAFTSSDFEVPTVTVTLVTANDLASNIKIAFNEVVKKQVAAGSWADVVALELNNVAVPFSVTAPAGAADGNEIIIDPTNNLNSNTTYTVRLRPDAVKDLSGNAIVTEKVYTVTTADLDALAVQYGSSVGATATTNLLANSTLKIDFNKAVKVNTTGTTWVAADAANLKAFMTFTKGGTAKAFTVTYDAATYTATVTPTDALVSNANDYVLTFDGTKVKDVLNVTLAAASVNYSVKDYNAPVVATSHNGDMASGVDLKITLTDDNLATLADLNGNLLTGLAASALEDHITFKENGSNGANLAFTAAYAGGVITITPAAALENGKTYYYGIGASVKDANGNVTAGKFSTFKIITPAAAPAILATTYSLNGSAQTPVATKLVNIVPKTGNVITVSVVFNDNIKETQSVAPFNTVSLTDGVTTWTVPVQPTNVSGNTLTVDFPTGAAIASEKECTLTLPAGIVQGSTAYTNTPAPTFAQFAAKTIKFDSKDIVKPTASANTPAAAAVNVALNTPIKISFDEKVVLGTGNILIKEGATVVQTIAVNSSNVTLDAAGTTATIVKTGDLPKYNVTYTVEVPVTAFTDDLSVNPMSAVYTGSFTTLPNPAPVVSQFLPKDEADMVASDATISITFSEKVAKNFTPGEVTLKGVYLMKKGTGATATLSGANYSLNLNGGNDVLVKSLYIDDTNVGVSDNTVTLNFGVALAANTEYYVLIAPESFKDLSLGSPIPGLFAGITAYGAWNFTTQDKLAPTVVYSYTKRADDKVATTSDITITFSKPIEKIGGGAITNSDVATLFTLKKTAGPGFIGAKAFVGEINADKTVVKVLNSSLVTLGEFTALSDYTIEINANAVRGKTNNVVLGANLEAFQTSDYTAPDVTVSVANAVADVKKDEATVTFASTDNVALTTVFYTIQEGDANTAAPAAAAVKADKSATLAGAAQTVTYKFENLKEETSYVVWAVAVDKAGNESAVKKTVFITDDATKPLLVGKPSSFVDGKLTFTFNEAVSPAANSVRILDAASMKEIAVLGLNAVADKPAQLVTDVWTPATTDALVNYYVEIDKGLVADVPVVATDNVNTFDGLFRTDLMVTSKDATAPVLTAPANAFANNGVNTTYSLTLTFSEPVQKVGTIPADAFKVEKETTPGSGVYEPFEVIDPANVVTNGTNKVVVNISRQLASTTKYQITINKASFEDLAGNDHAAGTLVGTITTKDVVAPTATFAPANAATGILAGVTTLTITFNEAIQLADNSAIDAYDLDSLVYFSKGATPVAFDAAIDGTNKVITLTVPALVKDATYTYGFKTKFEDASDNLVAAASATFKTETTTVTAQYLTWTPAKAVAPATTTWLGTTAPVTLSFTNPIFTYNVVAAKNNLPVTPANIAAEGIITVTKTIGGVTTTIPNSELVFTTPDNKTITVAPKTNWDSYAQINVILNPNEIQINEGNVVVLDGASSLYLSEDIVDPTVVTYYPAKVGVNGVSPVIAKTEKLTLTFSEDVKVGAGTVEIRRWDGVLAKPAMPVTVDATNKKLVTLGDLTGLPTNQEYYAIVNPGIVTDVTDSNPYAGFTEIKAWKFSLKDDAVPQVATYLPNAANTPVTTNLTINFDRPVELTGAGYVALYKSAAGGDAVQIMRGADNNPVTGPISISGNTVTIKVNPLSVNTQYFVEVAEGTFKSSTGVSQAGMPRGGWSFTTEGNANPTIIAEGIVPANNATGVSVNQDLEVTFDMPVEAGTGNIQLHAADGSIVYNFDVKGTDVIIADAVVKVNLPKLAENKQYYVIIPTTAIRNKTYTPEYFAGVIVPYEWKFNTKTDATAPKVVATSATAPGKLNIELKFSEPVLNVDTTSVTVSNAKIKSITQSTADTTIYNVVLTGEDLETAVLSISDKVKDAKDNSFEPESLDFVFGDYTGPKVVVTDPASPVPTVFKVGLKFNEAVSGLVNGGSAVVVNGGKLDDISKEGDSYILTVSAKEQTEVKIILTDAIKDMAPNTNKFAGDTLVYKTGDFTAPTLATKVPANAAELKDNHPAINLTFSEEVKLGAGGSLRIFKVNSTTAELVIPITESMINGKEVTVTYTQEIGGLNKDTRYYILVDGSALTDNAGNKFAGVSDAAAWTFKTGPFATGIEGLNEADFRVYPNPFVGVINIDNASKLSKVVVTNIAGQVVKEVVNPDNSIQLNELRSGVYFISLFDMDNVIAKTAKIVKR